MLPSLLLRLEDEALRLLSDPVPPLRRGSGAVFDIRVRSVPVWLPEPAELTGALLCLRRVRELAVALLKV